MNAATCALLLLLICSLCDVTCAAAGPSSSSSSFGRRNFPGQPYDDDDFVEKRKNGFQGSGREFNLFDTRERERPPSERFSSSSSSSSSESRQPQSNNVVLPQFVQDVQDWWTATFPQSPKLQVRFEPTCAFKVRKTFRPLGTILKIGADIPRETGVFRFHGSWEDPFLGGQLSYQGGELRLTKSWALPVSMGSINNNNGVVTRLRLRCAVDTQSWKAYARLGFRTEQLTPLNFMDGFPICNRIQSKETGFGLEVKSKVTLPQPEIEISTEIHNKRHTMWAGMADLEVDVEEVNFLWDL